MQRSMPAHLQKYAGGSTYIPQHAQAQLAKQMQKTMPAHMQEYITPYLHQQEVAGQMALHSPSPRPLTPRAPSPNLMRRDHSLGFGQQYEVDVQGAKAQATGSMAFTPQYQEPEPSPGQPDYSFITNPHHPAPRRSLPGANSLLGRMVLAGIGLVALLIIFSLVKGALSGPSVWPQYVGIAQDQAEILHLATNAAGQQGLATGNKNFALTAQTAMTTAQANTLQYLRNNGHKVSAKQLNLKISATLDNQLTTAAAASDYDGTFQQIMKAQLTAYQHDLQTAYAHTTGPKGRTLLSQDYDDAGLLLTQLQNQYQ